MAHQLCECSAKLLYLSAFHFPLLPLLPLLPSFYLNAACALLTLSSLFFPGAPSEYVFTPSIFSWLHVEVPAPPSVVFQALR